MSGWLTHSVTFTIGQIVNNCRSVTQRTSSPSIEWGKRVVSGVGVSMNLYAMLSSGIGTTETTSLSMRLAAWHDAMVAHERRLRSGRTSDACDDECPHVEAQTLWAEALDTFGP